MRNREASSVRVAAPHTASSMSSQEIHLFGLLQSDAQTFMLSVVRHIFRAESYVPVQLPEDVHAIGLVTHAV